MSIVVRYGFALEKLRPIEVVKMDLQAISTVAFLELDIPLDDQASHRQLNWPKNSSTWFRLISMLSCFTDTIWKIKVAILGLVS